MSTVAAAPLADTTALFDTFVAAGTRGDFTQSNATLAKLKVALIKLNYLEPCARDASEARIAELFLARSVLEHAALFAVAQRDADAFERTFAQLKVFYFPERRSLAARRNLRTTSSGLPPSERHEMLVGLNLLRLLSANRIAEFHTELELVALEQHSSLFIKYPIELEQALMEGSYHKIIKAKHAVPHDSFALFVAALMDTVRDQIAACSERAYDTLSLSAATKMLGFATDDETRAYAAQRAWRLDAATSTIDFVEAHERGRADVPSLQVMHQTLSYAKELERIV